MKCNFKFVIACSLATLCTASPLFAQEVQSKDRTSSESIESRLVPWVDWFSRQAFESTQNQPQMGHTFRDTAHPGIPMLNQEVANLNREVTDQSLGQGRVTQAEVHNYPFGLLETNEVAQPQQLSAPQGELVDHGAEIQRRQRGLTPTDRSAFTRNHAGQHELAQVVPSEIVDLKTQRETPGTAAVQTEQPFATRTTREFATQPNVTRLTPSLTQVPTFRTEKFATQENIETTATALQGAPLAQETRELDPLAAPLVSPDTYSLDLQREGSPVAASQALNVPQSFPRQDEFAIATTATTSTTGTTSTTAAAVTPAKPAVSRKDAGAIIARARKAAGWWAFVPYILFTLLGALCLSFFSMNRKRRSAQAQSPQKGESERSMASSLTTRSTSTSNFETPERSGESRSVRDLEFSQYEETANEMTGLEFHDSKPVKAQRKTAESATETQGKRSESVSREAVRSQQPELSVEESDSQQVSAQAEETRQSEDRQADADRKANSKRRLKDKGKSKRGSKHQDELRVTEARGPEFVQHEEQANQSTDAEFRDSNPTEARDVPSISQTDESVRLEQGEFSSQETESQQVSARAEETRQSEDRQTDAKRKRKSKRGSHQQNEFRARGPEFTQHQAQANQSTDAEFRDSNPTEARDVPSVSQTDESVRLEQGEFSSQETESQQVSAEVETTQKSENHQPKTNRKGKSKRKRNQRRDSQRRIDSQPSNSTSESTSATSESTSARELETRPRDLVAESNSRDEVQCSCVEPTDGCCAHRPANSEQTQSDRPGTSKRNPADTQVRDDLTQIEGIDWKTQQALHKAGFHRFSDVANADEKQLKRTLAKSNVKVSRSETRRWIRLAANAQQRGSQLSNRSGQPKRSKRTIKRQSWITAEINNAAAKDDLTRISGIDTASATLLQKSGIATFRQLYQAGPEKIARIFANGGTEFELTDTSQWAPQAKYAMNDDWSGLTRWLEANSSVKSVAKAPKSVATAPSRNSVSDRQDDLTRIKGIGPVAQKHLRENGVNTFEEIANMSVEELKALFSSNSRFQMLKQETWPSQARDFFTSDQKGDCDSEQNILDEIRSLSEMSSSVKESPSENQNQQVKKNHEVH